MNERIICLDIGDARIGVAVSDALDLTAQGVETIWTKGFDRDAARVIELCKQYETDRVLCGLPKNMDGSEGFQAQRVRAFAQRLEQEGLTIRFEDERLTTKLATSLLIQAASPGFRDSSPTTDSSAKLSNCSCLVFSSSIICSSTVLSASRRYTSTSRTWPIR